MARNIANWGHLDVLNALDSPPYIVLEMPTLNWLALKS